MAVDVLSIAASGACYLATAVALDGPHSIDMLWRVDRHPCDDQPFLADVWPVLVDDAVWLT
ncbi:MAG: hypothetical protein LC750_07550 [Actinobacteria bacterium]|nr:hypothetical protein [Actinomycetota bacterium]